MGGGPRWLAFDTESLVALQFEPLAHLIRGDKRLLDIQRAVFDNSACLPAPTETHGPAGCVDRRSHSLDVSRTNHCFVDFLLTHRPF